MKKLIANKLEDLRWWLIDKIATDAIQDAEEDALHIGFVKGRRAALDDILKELKANTDIAVIAEGHRVSKSKTSQATGDALVIGYDYAVGLVDRKVNPYNLADDLVL